MQEKIEKFFLKQQEPNKSCLLALRDTLLAPETGLTETVKYGMPCYTFNNKAVCYLWTDKKTDQPYILWVEGNQIDHPALEQGDRKRMKIQRIDPEADLPLGTFDEILTTALGLLAG